MTSVGCVVCLPSKQNRMVTDKGGYMTKSDLAEKIMEIYDFINKKDAVTMVDIVLSSISEALEKGDKVELRGFGTFKTLKRNARMARNPHTEKQIQVPEKTVPVFKPSPKLKSRVNKA